MEQVINVCNGPALPKKVKLVKYAKSYGWEVTCHGEDFKKIIDDLKDADTMLRNLYGNRAEEEK